MILKSALRLIVVQRVQEKRRLLLVATIVKVSQCS